MPVVDFQGIGNGIPIGAVVTTPDIAQVLTRRSYFNTFGGNPVSTAGGHAVLKVLEKEKLQENAFVVGSYLKEGLNKLKEKHDSKLARQIIRNNKSGHHHSLLTVYLCVLQSLVMSGGKAFYLELSW